MDEWVVRERGNGLTSAVEDCLDPIWTHVIDVPCQPFAFGKTGFAVCAELGHDGNVTEVGRAEAAARAKVAAAAPDLLEALKDLLDGPDDCFCLKLHGNHAEWCVRAMAAISKAQGDSEPGKRE